MEEKYTWIEPWSLTFTLLSYFIFLEFRVTPSSVHGNLGLTEVHGNLDPVQAVVCEGIFTFILVCSIYGCTDSNRPMFGSPAVGIGLTIAVVHLAAVSRHRCTLKRHPPPQWTCIYLGITSFLGLAINNNNNINNPEMSTKVGYMCLSRVCYITCWFIECIQLYQCQVMYVQINSIYVMPAALW